MQRSAMTPSSAREKTLPEGLFGLLKTMARVRELTARASRSGSNEKSGAPAGPQTGSAPAMMQHGAVVLVERLEDDDLVPRVQDGQQGGQHGLGGAGALHDVPVGLDVHAVELPVLLRDGPPERRRAPGDRVLVEVAVDGAVGRLDQLPRRGKVRHALGQVDAVVLVVDPGHLPDHRLGEALDALEIMRRERSAPRTAARDAGRSRPRHPLEGGGRALEEPDVSWLM